MDLIWKIYGWPTDGLNRFFWLLTWFVLFALPLAHEIWQYVLRRRQIAALRDSASGVAMVSANDLPDLHSRIGKIPLALQPWHEFRATLIQQKERVWATREFGEFLDYDNLQPWLSVFSPRVVANLPGWLTAIGILGTFIGLVIGLDKLDLSNSARLQQGIGSLVGGINTAYLTSIWGVTASILFLGVERGLADRTRHALATAAREVDRRFEVLTHEEVLLRILAEQEEQSGALKSFSTDLSDAIRQAFDKGIAEHLRPSIEKVTDLIGQVSARSTEAQEAALDQIVRSFVERMETVLSERFRELAATIDTAVGSMRSFTEEMGGTLADIREAGETQRMLLVEFEQTLGQTTAALQEVNGVMDRAQNVVATWDDIQREASDQARSLSEITAGFQGAAQQVVAAAAALDTCQAGLTTCGNRIAGSVDRLEVGWQGHADRFEQVNETLGTTAVEFADRVRSDVSQYLMTLDQELARATQSLATVAGDLEDTVDSLQAQMDRLTQAMGDRAKKREAAVAGNSGGRG